MIRRVCWSIVRKINISQSIALTAAASLALSACGGGGSSPGTPPPPPPPAATPPAVVTQPANATVAEGANATFTVSASGDAPLSYRWRSGTTELTDGAGISGASTATLIIGAPYSLNGARYSVRVSNAAGAVTSTDAVLTVTPVAPTINTQPANTTVVAGQSAAFTISVTGGTVPVTYQWKRDGVAIAGATSASYTLSAVALADNSANFVVDVTNPAGTISSQAASLTVTAPHVGSWSDPVRISANQGTTEVHLPHAAIDASGDAVAVWREIIESGPPGSTRYAAMANHFEAGNWRTPVRIDRQGYLNTQFPEVAMTTGGVAYAIFPQARSESNPHGFSHGYVTRYAAGSWSAPAQIENYLDATGHSVGEPRIAAHASGQAFAVWHQASAVLANQSDTSGAWPLTPVILDANGAGVSPRVAVGANGHAVTVWLHQQGTQEHLWASRNTGSGWSSAVEIDGGSGESSPEAAIAVDAVGNAMAVWSQLDTGSGRRVIRASQLSAATGTWGTPWTLSDGARDSFMPQVAVDGAGNCFAVWVEAQVGIFASRFVASTGVWTRFQLQPLMSIPGTIPQVAVDSVGNTNVVWLQPRTVGGLRADVRSSYCPVGGSCAEPVTLTAEADSYVEVSSYKEPSIAMNADGEAVLVWHERSDMWITEGIWARVFR
jgi:hypothetical protein